MPAWLSRAVITWVMARPAGMAGVAQRNPLSHRSGPHPGEPGSVTTAVRRHVVTTSFPLTWLPSIARWASTIWSKR